MKKFYTLLLLAIVAMLPQYVSAADPDLRGYTVIKTLDFTTATYSSDTGITLTSTKQGTAWETGNGKQQDIFDVATPEALSGYLAFQGTGSKGWTIRSSKGGLWSYNGSRSAAVLGLKTGYLVAFNCNADASTVMTMNNGDGEPDGPYTFEKSEDTKTYYATMTADGQVGFCGNKSKGYISSIVIYAPGTVVITPTAKYTGVNGVSRTVTFTGANLAYNTDGGSTYTNFKDEEGNNVNTAEVTVDKTTTYYVVSTNGDEKSEPLEYTIEAGTEISLATLTVSISSMSEGFTKTYSVACDNKDVLLTPAATLAYSFAPSAEGDVEENIAFDGTIEATAAGVYTVTASAEGYTSSTVTIDNTAEYELTKTIDITAITTADLSANWKLLDEGGKLPGSSSQWQGYYPDVTTDVYYYDFSSETASETDIVSGLKIENTAEGKTPKLCTGFGLMYPVYVLNADGTDGKTAITSGNISINEGTATQYGVYSYINNYGKNGTKTSVVPGDQAFSLYRFSDMLTKVEIYSQKSPAIPVADNIAAMKALSPGTVVKLKLTDAKVTCQASQYTFVEDATGGVSFDGSISELEGIKAGNTLNGYIFGTTKDYAGLPTLASCDNTSASEFTSVEATVTPTATTVAEFKATAKDMVAKYVSFANVKFGKKSTGYAYAYYLISGNDSIVLEDNFNVIANQETGEIPSYESIESAKGIVGISYDGTYEFWPIEIKGTVASAVVVENIAALKKLESGVDVKLMLKDTKITVNGLMGRQKMILIEDATGVITVNEYLASELPAFETDNVALNGYIYGKFVNEYGEIGLTLNDSVSRSNVTATPTTIVPKVVSIAEAATEENEFKLISITDAQMFLGQDGYTAFVSNGKDSIMIADYFMVMPYDDETGDMIIYDNIKSITGFTMTDGDVYQFYPYGNPAVVPGTLTGINDIQLNKVNGNVYTINGTLVRKSGESLNGLSKGLYIMGGKKVVIK